MQLSVRVLLVAGSLAQQLIVARIVEPSVYGIIGLCMLVMAFLTVFSETGVAGSIILEPVIDDHILSFAWTVQVIRGLLLGATLVLIAPLAAGFFSEPELTNLLQFLALSAVFTGLASPKLLELRREMVYGKLVMLQLTDLAVRIGISIPLALMWRNAWALLAPYVIASLVRTILSYRLSPFRPHWYMNREMGRRFSRFGRWAFVNSILHYFINEIDTIVIGRMLGSSVLGLYAMAYKIGNMPFTELGGVIGEVAFPAFRKAGENIKAAFLQVFGLSFAITAPMAVGLGMIAPPLVAIVLGDQWSGMIAPLQILCGWALFRSLTVCTGPLFNALGFPEIQTTVAIINVVTLVALIIPLTTKWGITGTAVAEMLSAIAVIPWVFAKVHKLIQLEWRDVVKLTAIPLLGVALMVGTVLGSTNIISRQSDAVTILTSLLVGTVTYGTWVLLASRFLGYQGVNQAKHLLHARRHGAYIGGDDMTSHQA
ncbi:MAG: lipopolysaccharide biosynthesis protein [Thermomicrobiales bacterium]|nr:lipopolysaccharide biosynthesis protein [Thermomicrobiales bacterium]MCO5219226.1 lipopolysaccharide biosynthesis protein [Thermomicrobiales bacterium]MCO5225055.1 lipopolysaccharide biosynthesis protein [Thermomicrobiales bacterium]MCO5228107.1 lipopolysaccharide biosynthesis protein [Thermomicrobiales bacterium]